MARRYSLAASSAAVILAGLLSSGASAEEKGYYNFPDINGDTIVFTAEGDLWKVAKTGGVAERLTRGDGAEYHARISPDGKTIAFAGQYDGNTDVYTIPMEGGEPKRLTFHPYSELPTGWTPDGKSIINQSARAHAHFNRKTFLVPVEGGISEEFPTGTSCYLVMAQDGKTVAFNRTYTQPRTWKRYGGGTADDVWIGDVSTGKFKRATTYFGNDLSPMFAGDRVYFASERDGRMNLWSMTKDGKDIKQHTKYTDFDVRYPESDDATQIVFQYGADIALFDTAAGSAKLVDITLPSDRPERREKFVSGEDAMDYYALSSDGRKALITARGDLFTAPTKSGRIIPLTTTSGIRESRGLIAGKDDQWAVYWSDKSGDIELYTRDLRTGENETLVTKDHGEKKAQFQHFYDLAVSPDGEAVAFSTPRGLLYTTNLTTKTLTLIDQSEVWEVRDYDFSPDNKFLAYAKVIENGNRQIFIHDFKSGENKAVTDGFFDAGSPTWDPEGKYLFYTSNRDFNRVSGNYEYEVVMGDATAIYATLLNKDAEDPFRKTDPFEEDDEKKEKKEKDKKEGKDGKKDEKADKKDKDDAKKDKSEEGDDAEGAEFGDEAKDKKVEVKIDFDGILDRQIRFPLDAGSYTGLFAIEGKIFFLTAGEEEEDEDDPHAKGGGGMSLMVYDYKADDPKPEEWASGVQGFALSRNREHILYQTAAGMKVGSTSAGKADPEAKGPNLGDIQLRVNPTAEWNQIVQEVYRYYRDYFYQADITRIDWKGVTARYAKLVDRISTRSELNDILGNLIGEIGHGHTYVFGEGDVKGAKMVGVGLLGADLEVDKSAKAVRLKKIYRGERWSAGERGALNTAKTEEVKDGWYLLAVNGKKVTTDIDPYSHFWGLAGKEVLLRLSPTPNDADGKNFRIRLLGDEHGLRYRSWVDANRRYVDEKTKNEVGYIHIPDMQNAGLVAFFRDFFPQLRKKALVVDVRWNGGGNVSQLLLRRLTHVLLGMGHVENFPGYIDTYPGGTFSGPMACIINENAGSDGDIFPNAFKNAKVGPLIGKRTWGGVVGIRSHTNLIDGGLITVPEFGYIDFNLGWDLENYGVDPTKGFEVDMLPEDEVAGRDPQLDRTIEYLLGEMGKEKYQLPKKPTPNPDRSTEAFKKRSADWMKKP